MKKYIINIVSSRFKNDPIGGGASSKAPADILTLAKENGYEEIDIYDYQSYGKLRKALSIIAQLWKSKHLLSKHSLILFQYPHINPRLLPFMMKIFGEYRKIAVVHDINSIRENGQLSSMEKKALNCFDELYVHSERMRACLKSVLRHDVKYKVIGCFPYLASPNQESRQQSNKITFAGNLDKSVFLSLFFEINANLDILLYGKTDNPLKYKGKAQYLGKFMPDEIQHIEGSWGLVWDGDSINGCMGSYGEYLKIIAPHKFSMYIAAELPVIVWDESAMASIVKENGLGITVGSLAEIEKIIADIADDEYAQMQKNIRNFIDKRLNVLF